MSKYIYFFNFGISFRDFYFYKTAASPDGLWWVRFQKKNDKMHRSLRSIGLLCYLWGIFKNRHLSNATGRIRDESLMNLGGRGFGLSSD
jgi:hypothetical protein